MTLFDIIARASLSERKVKGRSEKEEMEKYSKKTFLIAKTSLSRKQYYKSLTLLNRAGLIIKSKCSSGYVLTISGLVAYAAVTMFKEGTLHSLSQSIRFAV